MSYSRTLLGMSLPRIFVELYFWIVTVRSPVCRSFPQYILYLEVLWTANMTAFVVFPRNVLCVSSWINAKLVIFDDQSISIPVSTTKLWAYKKIALRWVCRFKGATAPLEGSFRAHNESITPAFRYFLKHKRRQLRIALFEDRPSHVQVYNATRLTVLDRQ